MQYATATAHATASARAAAGIANFIIDRKLIRDSIERRVWCSYNSAAALGRHGSVHVLYTNWYHSHFPSVAVVTKVFQKMWFAGAQYKTVNCDY